MPNEVTVGAGVLQVKTTQKEFENPPEATPILGVIAGWKDLGESTVVFKGKKKVIHKVAVKIFLDALDSKGENLTAYASFNASLNEKSGLTKFLKGVTGKVYANTAVNLMDFVGKTASFIFENVVSKTNGKTYSNIASVYPAKAKLEIPEGFIAFKDSDEDETPLPEGAVEIPEPPKEKDAQGRTII